MQPNSPVALPAALLLSIVACNPGPPPPGSTGTGATAGDTADVPAGSTVVVAVVNPVVNTPHNTGALGLDDAVVVLYPVVFDGSITSNANGVRLRGLTITGDRPTRPQGEHIRGDLAQGCSS